MFVCSLRSHHCFEEVLGLFCIKVLQVCCCSQVSANRAINRQTLATSEVLPMLTAISAIVEETTEDASAFLRLGVLNCSHAGRTVPGRFLDFARRRLKSQKKLRYREAHMQANSMKSCSIRGQVAFTVQIRLLLSADIRRHARSESTRPVGPRGQPHSTMPFHSTPFSSSRTKSRGQVTCSSRSHRQPHPTADSSRTSENLLFTPAPCARSAIAATFSGPAVQPCGTTETPASCFLA